MNGPVKLGIVGGNRGRALRFALQAFPEKVSLTAVCDISGEVVARWKASYPDIQTFTNLDELLEKGDCDAVFIGTPLLLHARQSIDALNAGKHVLCSVIAASTLDECWELVETVEKTGLAYMMEENYCYTRSNMMVGNMVEQGVFGDITYAEGAYIHDNRDLMFRDDGSLAWRGEMARAYAANTYPTHPLGPIAWWLRLNRPGGDRLATTATWQTASLNRSRFAELNFGSEHPASKTGYFARPDVAVTLLRTEKGAVVVIKTDTGSPRPHNMDYYALQGVKASYLATHPSGENPLIWVEGRSPARKDGIPTEWENLWDYAEEYEHPRWREWGHAAREAGHGGGDFFPLVGFADAVLTGKRPPIDVYDAATWSCLMPLSIESWSRGGAPVDVPDFTRGEYPYGGR